MKQKQRTKKKPQKKAMWKGWVIKKDDDFVLTDRGNGVPYCYVQYDDCKADSSDGETVVRVIVKEV